MAVTFVTTPTNVSGAPLLPNSGDLISVESGGNLYSTTGEVIIIGSTKSGVQLQIEGDVLCTVGSNAIIVAGTNALVSIESSGTVSSASTGISFAAGPGNQLLNAGTVTGGFTGVSLSGTSLTTDAFVQNLGSITGTKHGLIVGSGSAYIVNGGTIAGGPAASPDGQGDYFFGNGIEQNMDTRLKLDNSGTITGGNAGVHLNGTADTPGVVNEITNSGLISGGLYGLHTERFEGFGLFDSVLVVQNSGEIQGGRVGIESGQISLTNTGLISGAIALNLSSAEDTVINTGSIVGDVYLGNGDDVFNGSGGAVNGAIYGGDGDDTYTISDSDLLVLEAVGDGFDVLSSSVNYALGTSQEIEALTLTGTALRATGNDFGNTLTGNAEDNSIAGEGGQDWLAGGAADDTLRGGTGNDTLRGEGDHDVLRGQSGNDSLDGGHDQDVLSGQAGDDSLAGSAGDDSLSGGTGGDSLNGGDGADIVVGGQDRDTMAGGADADTFVFQVRSDSGTSSAGTMDVIKDFQTGVDVIDLSALDAKPATGANDSFVFLATGAFTGDAGQLRYEVQGTNIILSADFNGDSVADFQIRLNDISTLDAGDLIL